MTAANRPLRVFLCHSSNDKPAVRELYNALKSQDWIDPWLDKMKILPGQNWRMVIEEAVEEADVVIICLSNQSVNKEGFVQREIRYAYDIAMEKPDGVIFLIPLRLEVCDVPRGLRSLHWVDYFGDEKNSQYSNLIESLNLRSKQKLFVEAQEQKRVDQVSNQTNPISSKASQAKSLTYETPVEEKKPISETPKPAPVIPARIVKPAEVSNKLILSNGMDFMRVPAGKFLMGSDYHGNDEKPQHTVDIPYDYWMACFPVTNEQYNIYVKAKGISHPVSDWDKKKDHPVVRVNWNTVMEYCGWLNNLLKAELPSGLVLRLPSEAEWEKAARGTDGREYPWGNSFDKNKCNSSEGGKGGTTSVGSYSPQGDSPYGCADMSGNVWEWTHSEYKAYPYNAKDGREDEQKSVARVVRGGSYFNADSSLRCASRYRFVPNLRYDYFGFRVVVVASFPISLLHSGS